jgi:hypothetical protein
MSRIVRYRNDNRPNCNTFICNLRDPRRGLTPLVYELIIRRMEYLKSTSLIASFLLISGVALAHHSGVMFDRDKEVTVKGTVKEFAFVNPHVSILISVTDAKEVTADWSFEAASVRGLVSSGWRKSSLHPGDVVTLVGHPIKDGRRAAQLVRAILSDGTVLTSATGANY